MIMRQVAAKAGFFGRFGKEDGVPLQSNFGHLGPRYKW